MPLSRSASEPGSVGVAVSRHSGLISSCGTFGTSERFPKRLIGCKGAETPRHDAYYSNVRLYKKDYEKGIATAMGFGQKRSMAPIGISPPAVGPGSYNHLVSVNKSRSPLDGPEFSTTTMKIKLGSSVGATGLGFPGPTAYNVRKEPDYRFPTYAQPRMRHGGRPRFSEDSDGPGYSYSSHNLSNDSPWMKAPSPRGDVSPLESATGGSKRRVKSTFGTSQRFKDAKGSPTPGGSMYYAHVKQCTGEDYLKRGATSLGFGAKVDLANPYKAHIPDASPASYTPLATVSGTTSPLDGFTIRARTSPAAAAAMMSSTGGKRMGAVKDTACRQDEIGDCSA